MIAVDTSVLAWAVNRFAPEHGRAAAILDELVNGERRWGLPWPAAHEFVAVVTHPHRVARVLAPADAWGYLTELLASPSCEPLGPGERHARVCAELLATLPPGSPLPPGFELAAVLREHGVATLLSGDRDMRRYAFLELVDPIRDAGWSPDRPSTRRYRRLSAR